MNKIIICSDLWSLSSLQLEIPKRTDKLFDVFNQDKPQRKKMEKNYELRMNEADRNFYHDPNVTR